MPTIGNSALRYLERRQLTNTMRSPSLKYNAAGNRIHSYPLDPPLPHPGNIGHVGPDAGDATIWPHGSEGETV
jgi:hypothetical protein